LAGALDLDISFSLRRTQDQEIVAGRLVPLSDKFLHDSLVLWTARLSGSKEEDSHWDWHKKYRFYKQDPTYEMYSIELEQIAQGLIIIEIDFHRSRCDPGKPIVYVDFLATAPWNRQSLENPPRYRGVGSALLEYARIRSCELEYQGRLGLHSLSGAENFYKAFRFRDDEREMKNFGPDYDKQNLTYFEREREKRVRKND
jgi:GNAT superfamily N-acetyltransferase